MERIECDVLIVGASLGGVAAALRAGAMRADVCLIEESGWVGGQWTSQGVCTPDENMWIETSGGTATYLALREEVRRHYRENHRLSEAGAGQPHLNPGSCWVSRLAMEPQIGVDLLERRLAALPNVDVRLHTRPVRVETVGDTIAAVIAVGPDGVERHYTGSFVLDATELGDLLAMADVEHALGAESRAETGEPDAPEEAHADWIQPFTFVFALEQRPVGENHTIAPPPDYEALKAQQQYHILDGSMRGMFGDWGWWTYRRILAAANFDDPAIPCDVATINTGSNDYMGGIIPTGAPEADAATLERARRASLGYVYWLQTECPRVDDPTRCGYPEFKLRGDLFETADGIAPHPYIRESRRIRARRTILQHEIVEKDSQGTPWQTGPRALHCPDSCGIGHYWLDIHRGPSPEPGRFYETRPFQIPLGALIPVRASNLLPACKNLGVTHLTNGAYRLHPIEWNVGESAGALAAFCLRQARLPRDVYESPALLAEYQHTLLEAGIPLFWWADVPPTHPVFVAAQTLGMAGLMADDPELRFRPDDPLTAEAKRAIQSQVDRPLDWPAGTLTRAEAAQWLTEALSA